MKESVKSFDDELENLNSSMVVLEKTLKFTFPQKKLGKNNYNNILELLDKDSLFYSEISEISKPNNLSNIRAPNEQNYMNNYKSNTIIEKDTKFSFNNSKNDNNLSYILKYKALTEKIEQHLNDPQNEICFLKNLYIKNFQRKYDYFYNCNETEIFKHCEYVYKDLIQFILILQNCVYLYYDLPKLLNYDKKLLQQFNHININNFISCLIINPEIFNLIFEMQRKIDKKNEEKIKRNYLRCKDVNPEDLGVSQKFCLNEKTLKVLEIKQTTLQDIVLNYPFQKAIECLRTIQFFNSPVHKIKVLLLTNELIISNILEFYSEIGISIDIKELDFDELIAIFVYVISKSAIPSILTHCKIIDKLLSNDQLESLHGFYLIVLKQGLQYFCETNYEEFQNNLDLQSFSIIKMNTFRKRSDLRASFAGIQREFTLNSENLYFKKKSSLKIMK